MAIDFAALKKNRGSTLTKLAESAAKFSNKFEDDKRFWKLSPDKSGNGFALIRFLPEVKGEDFYFVRYYDFGFKGPGGWYIEKSLQSIGMPDPCEDHNRGLWAAGNAGDEASKTLARERGRRTNFVSNILVINDPANAENNGKVFLFRYGKEIMEMLTAAANPNKAVGEPELDPMNMWEGNNFRLKSRKKDGGFITYDRSSFEETKSAVGDSDAEIEAVWTSAYPLREWTVAEGYKTFEELKTKLDQVLDTGGGARGASARTQHVDDDVRPQQAARSRPAVSEPVIATKGEDKDVPWDEEDEIVFDKTTTGTKISVTDDDDDLRGFDDLVKD